MNFKAIAEKAGFVLRQASPEILLGTGVVLSLAAIITACAKMKETDEVREELQEELEVIEETEVRGTKEYLAAHFKAGAKAIFRYLVIFWLPILLWLLSMGSFWYSHGIMVKRNADLASVVVITMQELDKYRGRVREKVGSETENDLFYGLTKRPSGEVITVTDENGKEKKIKQQEKAIEDLPFAPFDRLFDRTNHNFQATPGNNLIFINGVRRSLEDKLRYRATNNSNGWLTINEVYNELGFESTEAGFNFGWIYSKHDPEYCSTYLDFGVNECSDQVVKDYLSGKETVIPLHFNCRPIDIRNLKLKKI